VNRAGVSAVTPARCCIMLTHVSLTRADFAQVRQRLDSYTFLLIACTLYAASRAVVPKCA
jgi:hypothetical protein